MQEKDDKAGNETHIKKKSKGEKESEKERLNRLAKKY